MTQNHTDRPPPAPQGSLLERAILALEAGALSRPLPSDGAAPANRIKPERVTPNHVSLEQQPSTAAGIMTAVLTANMTPFELTLRSGATPAPPKIAAPTPSVFRGGRYRIDRDGLRDAGLIVPESGITAQLEEFRLVKRQLLQQAEQMRRSGGGGAAQRVLITSPLPGEGKSYCAANLALSIAAERDSEVVLVDFDAAKNTVLGSLGLPNGPGLIDALADPDVDILDCVMCTDIPGLSVLPGGHSTSSDNEYLASARTHAVLDQLTSGAPNRIVLFDSPPTLAASLPVELAKLVGQVALVVMADRTSQGAIEDAVSLLSGCPNVQLLLNAVQFSPSGRRFGTYYK